MLIEVFFVFFGLLLGEEMSEVVQVSPPHFVENYMMVIIWSSLFLVSKYFLTSHWHAQSMAKIKLWLSVGIDNMFVFGQTNL